jgi:hypothetical protein
MGTHKRIGRCRARIGLLAAALTLLYHHIYLVWLHNDGEFIMQKNRGMNQADGSLVAEKQCLR